MPTSLSGPLGWLHAQFSAITANVANLAGNHPAPARQTIIYTVVLIAIVLLAVKLIAKKAKS